VGSATDERLQIKGEFSAGRLCIWSVKRGRFFSIHELKILSFCAKISDTDPSFLVSMICTSLVWIKICRFTATVDLIISFKKKTSQASYNATRHHNKGSQENRTPSIISSTLGQLSAQSIENLFGATSSLSSSAETSKMQSLKTST